jgi:SAM-dependent methyltransferase
MTAASTWAHGYPVHESYPASWHAFQSPAHLKLLCALQGVAWDVDASTPLCIAEVGCGTGYTALMLAAGNPHWQVWGLDYNPAHIAEARSLAQAAGLANVHFLEADVSDLAQPDSALLASLPAFDLVTAHGFWTWVADDVRHGLLALLQHRLKAGGLALVSYNALPGSAAALGLSRVVQQALGAGASTEDGLAAARGSVQALVAAQANHLPDSAWRRMLTGEAPSARAGYLLHEFSTSHWRPCFQADVAAAMSQARCDYVGSASLDENFPHLSLSPAQRVLWDEAPDSRARELVFDLCVPRPFRRDVYVRGLRRVPRDAAVDALSFVLADVTKREVKLQTQLGEASLPGTMIDAVRRALATGPRRIAELRQLPGCTEVSPAELAAVLAGSGCALPMWRMPGSGRDWDEAVAAARRLNAVTSARMAPHGMGTGQFGLATPVLGGGLRVSALELAVAHRLAGLPQGESPEPAAVAEALLPAGERPSADVLSGLIAAVRQLLVQRASVWTRLGI